jgi:hypothetical protein
VANWYLADSGRQAMGGHLVATSLLTSVAGSITANALGSWVQMHAASGFPVDGMYVFLGQTGLAASASNTQTLLDIGIGPSGSETAIALNIAIGGSLPFTALQIPIAIEANNRIVVRIRSAVSNKSCTMGMSLYGGGTGLESGYRAVTYGANTASSTGTVLTAPAATNSESAWTQISASTTATARWMVVGLSIPNTATATAINGLLDIGIGAAGSEVGIVNDIPYAVSTAEDINAPYPLTYPVNVPAGIRLAARYRGTSTATAAAINVTVTGIS